MRKPIVLALVFFSHAVAENNRFERYAVVVETPPVTAKPELARAAQESVRAAISARGVRILHSSARLVNAVYVIATEEQAKELGRLYGVSRVARMRTFRRTLEKATELVNAPAAWNIVGGPERAGLGVKIGILDSGIDQNHPSLNDTAGALPAGYPKCRGGECDYTNRKVIAARSYVDLLVLPEDPAISRPDDLSPRDRVGHGTAAATAAAGREVQGPAAKVRGVAPAAWLGNYKIFGSPGVNDVTFDDVIIAALEDALADGMDIVSLSFAGPALWAPGDRGSDCGVPSNEPCDLLVDAVEAAVKMGLTVVTAAGNEGDLGIKLPTLNSIQSPGVAPSAITVGASTNALAYYSAVVPEGSDTGQQRLRARQGNGPRLAEALTAPLADVARLGNDGKACSPLSARSLEGAIALIQRGDCGISIKINNAQKAGAVGVVLYQSQSNGLTPPSGLRETGIPAVLIGKDDAAFLKTLLGRQSNRRVTIDPGLKAASDEPDLIAYFSSQGPSIGDSLIKPDLSAVGASLYMGTQKYDPNGELYDATGFTTAQGTSFAAPLVAGAAAIVKQRYPRLKPGQLKSMVVNTAADVLTDFDYDDKPIDAPWTAGGAGLLNVRDAARANFTIEPASLSFGAVTPASGAVTRTLVFSNPTSSNITVQLEARPNVLSLTASTLTIPANSSRELQVRLTGGTRSNPGAYEGEIRVTGAAVPMRIPFLFLVTDIAPFNAFPLRGYDFSGIVSEPLTTRLTFKVVDRNGAPVANVPVRWSTTLGDGEISDASPRTDSLGIAEAKAKLGPRLGEQEFAADAGGLTVYFTGIARQGAIIETNGVVNTAGLGGGQPAAPGSYVSILGRGLSDAARTASTPYLPLSLAGVSVSFDVPGRKESHPGRLSQVSPERIDVQVPWELAGVNSVQLKVSLGDYSSAVYTLPLNDYSPGLFELAEQGTGRMLAAARDQAFQPITTANPARRGQTIFLLANGLGPVENRPASGEPSPQNPPSATRSRVEVSIGGSRAAVSFAGLSPGAIGLYQINVAVPDGAASGLQTVAVSVNGISAKPVLLPVE